MDCNLRKIVINDRTLSCQNRPRKVRKLSGDERGGVMSESVMLGLTVSCYCHYWRFLLVFLATHPPCSQYGANETVIIGILPRQGAADGLSQVVILFQSFIHLGKMKNQNNLIKCECVREMFIVYFLHHEQSHALNGAGCEHGTSI